MRKFHIGDTVKVTHPNRGYEEYRDKIGKIFEIEAYYHVRFSSLEQNCFEASELELVKPKAKKTLKKKETVSAGFPCGCYTLNGKLLKSPSCTYHRQPENSTEVTFKITRLEDDTELIFIPTKEWTQVNGVDEHFMFKRKKK